MSLERLHLKKIKEVLEPVVGMSPEKALKKEEDFKSLRDALEDGLRELNVLIASKLITEDARGKARVLRGKVETILNSVNSFAHDGLAEENRVRDWEKGMARTLGRNPRTKGADIVWREADRVLDEMRRTVEDSK